MSRKKKMKRDFISKWLKRGLKASTHLFTASGVLVATAPLHRGLTTAVQGAPQQSANQIVYDTTGLDTSNLNAQNLNYQKVIGTVVLVGLGVALIAGGAQLRKRIGS